MAKSYPDEDKDAWDVKTLLEVGGVDCAARVLSAVVQGTQSPRLKRWQVLQGVRTRSGEQGVCTSL